MLGTGTRRLSGPALKPIALAAVYRLLQSDTLPIVGMGGVASGRDALELFAAGASAVALGTVLFADPAAPARIREELAAELAALGLAVGRAGARDSARRGVAKEKTPRSRVESLEKPCKSADSNPVDRIEQAVRLAHHDADEDPGQAPVVLSISAWRPSRGRTTFASAGRS